MSETPPTSEARETARIRFLQIAHELKPELVRSLYEEVLPPYHGPNPAPKREVYISNYKKVLKAWLARWNLFEEWQLRHATDAISTWAEPFLWLWRGKDWPDDLADIDEREDEILRGMYANVHLNGVQPSNNN